MSATFPPVVAGRHASTLGRVTTTHSARGEQCEVAHLDERDVDQIATSVRSLLDVGPSLTLRDVSLYLHGLAVAWLDRIPSIERCWGSFLEASTGFNFRTLRADYESVGWWLRHRANHYDMLRADLGSTHAFDEWSRVESVRQRAVARGLVLHNVVGNIPLAGLFSCVRGLITRNANVLKVPSRDPVSVHEFVSAAIEAAPDHPLTGGLTAGYWGHDDDVGRSLGGMADSAQLWGSADSVVQVRNQLRHDTVVAAFGPRWSAAVVDLTDDRVAGLDEIAERLAIEVATYDQEACLSPLRVYVVGEVEALQAALERSLDTVQDLLPRRRRGLDVEAQVLHARLLAHSQGWPLSVGQGWTVFVEPADHSRTRHPLSRTVILVTLESVDELESVLDRDAQTFAVHPYEIGERVAEALLRGGGSRVVELGLSRHVRRGFVHDGARPLQSMVRWVSIEDDLEDGARYGTLGREGLIADLWAPLRGEG